MGWLAGILRRCERAFAGAGGLYAYLHDVRSGRDVETLDADAVPELEQLLRELQLDRAWPPTATDGIAASPLRVEEASMESQDAPCARARLRAAVHGRWTTLAQQVAAELRLRESLVDAGKGRASPSSPEGRERANGHDRGGDDTSARDGGSGPAWKASAALFPALVAGRFSLVDQWDSGGRRSVAVLENPRSRRDPCTLTSAELRVARGLVDGRSVKELADALVVSSSTITTLASNVYRKLGVRSRNELRVLADVDLASAIPAFGEGSVWLCRTTASLPEDVACKLSSALADVLVRLLAGCSTREIARARGTSVATVEKQLTRVYRTLGIRCRGDLGRLTIRKRRAARAGTSLEPSGR